MANMIPMAQTKLLSSINEVEGFDPSAFAVEYTDLITGETRKRLPVMAQIAWFRLKYPEGKICLSVTQASSCFVATAKVYPSYQDPSDCYLAEATASRGPDPSKPAVSPREWAQTAAVGIALRNAGFGLQFGAAGEDFSAQAPNELGVDMEPLPGQHDAAPESSAPARVEAPVQPAVIPELTPEQKFQQALAMICPIKKYAGKTLGDVLNMDPSAINWLAVKYPGDPKIAEAARFICEYATEQTTA